MIIHLHSFEENTPAPFLLGTTPTTSVQDHMMHNLGAHGTLREWAHDLASGIDYLTREPRCVGAVATVDIMDPAPPAVVMFVEAMLTAGKPIIVWDGATARASSPRIDYDCNRIYF